jgi:hypothetical protein
MPSMAFSVAGRLGYTKICIFELDCILPDGLMSLLAQGFQAQLIV